MKVVCHQYVSLGMILVTRSSYNENDDTHSSNVAMYNRRCSWVKIRQTCRDLCKLDSLMSDDIPIHKKTGDAHYIVSAMGGIRFQISDNILVCHPGRN